MCIRDRGGLGGLHTAQEWVAEVPDPLADADSLPEAAASVAPSAAAPTVAPTIAGRPVPERLHLGQRLVFDEDEMIEYKDYSAQVRWRRRPACLR